MERRETLLRCLYIVILTLGVAGCLGPLHDAIEHGLLAAVEEEHELEVNSITHYAFPALLIFQIARESIDEVLFLGPASLLHRILDEVDCDLDGYDLAIDDIVVDELGLLAAAVTLYFY